MPKKLKEKIHFETKRAILLLGGALALVFFVVLFPKISSAACTGLRSPYSCDQSTISLGLSSSQVKIGEQVTFTVTINTTNTGRDTLGDDLKLKDQKTVRVATGGRSLRFQTLPANASNTIIFEPVTINAAVGFSKPGTYKIEAEVESSCAGSELTPKGLCDIFVGPEITLQVLAASNTGPAILTLDSGQKRITNSLVEVHFNFTYLSGASGKQPSRVLYYCKFDGKEDQGYETADMSSGAGLFNCVYDQTPKSYQVFIKALDDNKQTFASDTKTVQVTGNEKNEGSTSTGSGLSILGLINQFISGLLGFLQEVIYTIFYWLIAPLIQAMLSIHTYTDQFAAVIYPGWIVVRNLSNIIFIVALIAIGVATLLRIESYQYKHLLVQLVLAALLVNFSLVIGQAILGVADTVQSQFLPNNVEVIRALARDLMVGYRTEFWSGNLILNGQFSDTVRQLFWLSLSIGSFLVFAAIAAFLAIRIVMLWILLMISPIAYVAGVLPSTAQYRGEWWTTFLKYAFFTPIMAFFLNMAAVIANTSKTVPVLKQISGENFGGSVQGDLAAFVFKVASNLMLLVFLVVALMVAEKAGIYMGKEIGDWAKKGMFAPFTGAGWLAQVAGRKVKKHYDKGTSELANGGWLARQAFKATHPVAFVKGLMEESKKERELYKARVEAGATEVARKQYGWRRKTESPMFLFDEHKGKELYEEEEGEWSDNEQIVVGIGNRLLEEAEKGDLRAQIKLKHWFTEAFRHKNLNEAMEGDNGLANNHLGGKLNYNSNNIRYFFQKLKDKGVIDENFTKEFLKKLSKDGYEIGDFNGVELVYNDEHNHPHMIKMEEKLNADGSRTGDAMPVGWDEYTAKREDLINQADALGRLEASNKLARGVPPEQVNVDVEIERQLKTLEDGWAGNHDNYANAMHAERGRRYMKINISKRNGQEQVKMFHDSIVNVGVEDGRARVSDAGSEVLGHMDANKLYAMGRDNMPAKTRDKFMRYINGVAQNPTVGLARIEEDLEKVIKAKYRENGVKRSNTEITKEVTEQRNLWLAAGYSILSSKPGANVMENYFEKISEKNAAAAAGVPLATYQAGGVTLTPAQQTAAATAAAAETQQKLIESIMNFKK